MINGQFFAVLIFALTLPIYAQTASEKLARKYACLKKDKKTIQIVIDEVEVQEKLIAEDELNSKKMKFIDCEWSFSGCPVNLVMPIYPRRAKELGLHGLIKVEIIFNERGSVIYAHALNGSSFLQLPAQKSACQSRFFPFYFNGTTVKKRKIIGYNFILP